MAEIVQGEFGPKAVPTLARDLRNMADAVDRGEIVDFVSAYHQGGRYTIFRAASLESSLVLACLLQNAMVEKFKEQP